MLAFLTVSLTNCGQKPHNNIAQELEESFQTDDLSAIPLEESDLEEIAKQGPLYQLLEIPSYLSEDSKQKYFGKVKTSYVYHKDKKQFEIQRSEEFNESEKTITQTLSHRYQSESPYTLLSINSSFSESRLANSEILEFSQFQFNCTSNICSFKTKNLSFKEGKKVEKSFAFSVLKTQINPSNLKEQLLPQLIARHRFDMERIRINSQVAVALGLASSKRIFYFSNPSSEEELKYSIITKNFDPRSKDKYTLDKMSSTMSRTGQLLSTVGEFSKYKTVNASDFESTPLDPIKNNNPFILTVPENKKFEFAYAIVKGPSRYLLKNTRMQQVTHHAHHSEVELLDSNRGIPDESAPTNMETTNKKEHYVEPEWQSEILKSIKGVVNTSEKALKIMIFVASQIRGTKAFGSLSFKELYDLKRGDCSEFTKTFVLLARENGIAARKNKGYILPKKLELNSKGEFVNPGGAHTWANYFSPEKGEWIYADVAMAAHAENKEYNLLDFGVNSPNNIEVDDYSERPSLYVRFVFDTDSKEKAIKELSQP